MKVTAMKAVESLLYQVLETELVAVKVYEKALACTIHEELSEEWRQYLAETNQHVSVAERLLLGFGLDPMEDTPPRLPVRKVGEALVQAMELARQSASAIHAELTAAECVLQAESKDYLNWELVAAAAKQLKGEFGHLLAEAHRAVEGHENHHFFRSSGWVRELWLQALGVPPRLSEPDTERRRDSQSGAVPGHNHPR